jgi:hypothetical protein
MLPPLSKLVVVPHDHFGPLVTQKFGRLGDTGPGLKQVGAYSVAVEISHDVIAKFEFVTDTTKPTTDGVAIPWFAVAVTEEWALGALRHQPFGQRDHLRCEDNNPQLPSAMLSLVVIKNPQSILEIYLLSCHACHFTRPATSVLKRQQEVEEAVSFTIVVCDLLTFLPRDEAIPCSWRRRLHRPQRVRLDLAFVVGPAEGPLDGNDGAAACTFPSWMPVQPVSDVGAVNLEQPQVTGELAEVLQKVPVKLIGPRRVGFRGEVQEYRCR